MEAIATMDWNGEPVASSPVTELRASLPPDVASAIHYSLACLDHYGFRGFPDMSGIPEIMHQDLPPRVDAVLDAASSLLRSYFAQGARRYVV